MQNRSSEELFALIKGMTRSEKKSFHLYARRNMNSDHLKVLALYNAINTMDAYDEKLLVKKLRANQPKQLPGLKVNLYNLLLDSLRIVNKDASIDLQLHQLMDHARIWYDKGFPAPALKALKRVKALALRYHQVSFAFHVVVMEKKIELVYGRCDAEKIAVLNQELLEYSAQLSQVAELSNVSMELYGWYMHYGEVRNQQDERTIDAVYQSSGAIGQASTAFYPCLYRQQAKTYYYIVRKQPRLFYEAARDWVELFQTHPEMKEVEQLQYHRGLAYLSDATLQNNEEKEMVHALNELRNAIDPFYRQLAELNHCLFRQRMDEDLLKEVYSTRKGHQNNEERILLLFYKAALLCMNCNQYNRAIDFTHNAIDIKTNLRIDLQYKLRLLHTEAHRKLGNVEIVDYLHTAARRFARAKLMMA